MFSPFRLLEQPLGCAGTRLTLQLHLLQSFLGLLGPTPSIDGLIDDGYFRGMICNREPIFLSLFSTLLRLASLRLQWCVIGPFLVKLFFHKILSKLVGRAELTASARAFRRRHQATQFSWQVVDAVVHSTIENLSRVHRCRLKASELMILRVSVRMKMRRLII